MVGEAMELVCFDEASSLKFCLVYPNRLQVAAMPILETEVCKNASNVYSAVSRTAFCAGYLRLVDWLVMFLLTCWFSGGVDSCQGDSGNKILSIHTSLFRWPFRLWTRRHSLSGWFNFMGWWVCSSQQSRDIHHGKRERLCDECYLIHPPHILQIVPYLSWIENITSIT